ncbi:MAG: sigma factor-like helix-turn-helix DNA-binding protein [Paludibacteraceae bacterium]
MRFVNYFTSGVESDLRERIDKAIAKLPEKCRKIFVMNLFDGIKPVEIADREGISVRTVEGHIGKAYKLLREELKPYLPGFVLAILLSKFL